MNYVPRILLCGDVESFRNAAGDMAVDIVGQISFTGSAERGENFVFSRHHFMDYYKPGEIKIFLNGTEISADALRKILDGTADYIVLDRNEEFIGRRNDLHSLGLAERYITRDNLFRQARHNFYSTQNMELLAKILHGNEISNVLDVDGIFYETDYFLFPEKFPRVEGVISKPEPILENFYGKIYSSLADCRFKFYDAIFIGEREPDEFIDALITTEALTEKILTFARKSSALENFLTANENIFEKVSAFPALNGNWYLIQKRVAKDFCVYVVTHKDAKLDALPEGYRIIHAGHAQAKQEFGYLGDDTGDNISELNLYLNELTALYWIWKNTSHTVVGLCHYRRFFTEATDTSFAVEKILSREATEKILRDYDIIVAENAMSNINVTCWQMLVSGDDLESFVEKIFREHIALKQPDYLDAFNRMAQSFTGFPYEMFITRRNILNAYCGWLFSFLLDILEEVFARTNLKQVNNSRKYRIVGMFSEWLMTIWLSKNRLRIKKLPVIFREGI